MLSTNDPDFIVGQADLDQQWAEADAWWNDMLRDNPMWLMAFFEHVCSDDWKQALWGLDDDELSCVRQMVYLTMKELAARKVRRQGEQA